jgi:hypothetical protein
MNRKQKTAYERKTFTLLDQFDDDARDWGWTQDQGTGSQVDKSNREYDASKKALEKHLNGLHEKIRSLKHKLFMKTLQVD